MVGLMLYRLAFSCLLLRHWLRKHSQALQKQRVALWNRRPRRRFTVLRLEQFEDRVTPTGDITITNVSVVDGNDQPLSTVNVGQQVYIQAAFTTQGLPSNASYRIAYTVNGLTLETGNLTWGAGASGTGSWYAYWGTFIATPGTNQVSVAVDPSSYGSSSMDTTFDAVSPAVGSLSYTVAQIRSAYGINNIPHFGSATADGSGQTIALVEAGNDPNIITDLDNFDKVMSLTATSNKTLYQLYGNASSILSVYNQYGTNITANIAHSGGNGVPAEDPTGHWEGEETLDVEWAHAIAPGAKIDVIEVNDDANWPTNLLAGDALAASLPGVSAVSNSWGLDEWSGQTAYDSSTFVTPSGHTGVTFLTASNDNGANVYGVYGPSVGSDGYYPATSPNVVSVGGTELTLNNNSYGSETGWSYPAPTSTIDNGSSFYSQTGSWTAQTGGFSGSYSTAAGGSSSFATWTIPITPANTGWGTEVSTTCAASPSNATNATYTIYDGTPASGAVLGTVTVDQTKAPVGTADGSFHFQELGVFFPTLSGSGDGTLTVVLKAHSANGTVVADAIGAAPAWASTGGPSQFETEPSYQRSFQHTGKRTTPDVSFDASDNSGVTVFYTPFNDPANAGLGYGDFGTSLSSPCWAGLIAVANQGRVSLGAPTLNSTANPMQTLQALYSLPARDFHDITSGYNGFSAGLGYDFVTGRGSPISNLLIPDLVRYGIPTVTSITPTHGPRAGGTSVKITGTNFTSVSTVHFGTVAATRVTFHSVTSLTAVAPAESAGTVNVTVTTADGTSATSNADKFTYAVAPAITTQPTNQTVKAGGTATFTAKASGSPTPTVQWQVSTNGGNTWTNLSGATSTTLKLSNVKATQNGDEYQAVFTNIAGSATTSAATLTVQFAPIISTNPSNQTVDAGKNATFTAAASGNPKPKVQWQVSSNGGSTWTNLSGATSTTLTLTSVTSAMNRYEYEAVFSDSLGTTTTSDAMLTVQPAPTVMTNFNSLTPALAAATDFSDSVETGVPATGTQGAYSFTMAADSSTAMDAAQSFVLAMDPSLQLPPHRRRA
jgi:hypothetical protein